MRCGLRLARGPGGMGPASVTGHGWKGSHGEHTARRQFLHSLPQGQAATSGIGGVLIAALAVSVVSMLSGVSAGGAQSLDEDILFEEIPLVYSASKHEQKVTAAPASVSVITAAEIARYGCRTLYEALNSLRGFSGTTIATTTTRVFADTPVLQELCGSSIASTPPRGRPWAPRWSPKATPDAPSVLGLLRRPLSNARHSRRPQAYRQAGEEPLHGNDRSAPRQAHVAPTQLRT